MNIVIIGNGKVGRKLTEILSNDNHDIVIIDKSYNEINKIINNYDVKAVHGNGASYEIQKKAGVDKADILIAVTPSDEINLISCFISKKIGVNKSIALISNLEYYNQLEFIQNNFNIDFVVNPEKSVANNIVNLILLPSCLRLKPFLNNDISLVELDMNVNNKLVNRDISYINKKLKSNIIVYCIERGNQFLLPKKEFMLKEEDKIYLIGYNNDLKKLFKIIDAYEDEIKSVMIIGGGKLGVCLSNLLIGLDLRVKIIESDIQKCRFISSNVPKARIINEDGTVHEILIEEGINNTDIFIAMTGIDEKNIIISMFATHCSVKKVITKIEDLSIVNFSEFSNLKTFVSPKDIISQNIVEYIQQSEGLYNVKDNSGNFNNYKIIRLRVTPKDKIINKRIKNISIEANTVILSIIRNNIAIIPDDEYIAIDDIIIVFTLNKNIRNLNDIY